MEILAHDDVALLWKYVIWPLSDSICEDMYASIAKKLFPQAQVVSNQITNAYNYFCSSKLCDHAPHQIYSAVPLDMKTEMMCKALLRHITIYDSSSG